MKTDLIGKVVVVTGMRKIPMCCIRCPFYDNMGGKSGHINYGVCKANGSYRSTSGIQVTKMRLDSCPLKVVDDGHGKNKPLTIKELQQMDGEPVYWAEEKVWGIVKVDSHGQWKDKPFLIGHWHGVYFERDIERCQLKLYRHKPKGA